MDSKNVVAALLKSADIEINGNRPGDIHVHNNAFYNALLKNGALGLGESYMDGWWDCDRLDIFIYKLILGKIEQRAAIPLQYKLKILLARIVNMQSRKRAGQVATRHYNLGNTLFEAMLDKRMMYSCAYFKNATTLDEAQEAKLDLICRKLQLQAGMRLLDIGCGWGGLARFAAEKYNTSVVGVTISKEQVDYARKYCQGLPVEIRLQDYRSIEGNFDRIVSVGMFEHVGPKNYRTFMKITNKCLTDNGLFLLHTIGGNNPTVIANTWISKYIFPNGVIPAIEQIGKAINNLFIMEDWHNFGTDYDLTLMEWYKNFINHWPELKKYYDDEFFRMWSFYLLSCAGSFRARDVQLWQIVLSKGVLGGYIAPR